MFGNIPARKILKFITSKRILLAAIVLGFLLSSHLASAEGYRSLVKIPGMPENPDVFEYLGGLYKFLMSAIGIVAMGAIVIGGARYLTSVGNPAAIEDAKHTIYSAITGLILALSTWVIISEINPDILVLKKPGMPWTGGAYTPAAKTIKCGSDLSGACVCNDGFQLSKRTATKITLSVAPSSVAAGSNFTFSGKLTNLEGTPLPAGKKVTAILYSAKENNSISWKDINVNDDGSFSKSDFVNCKSDLAPNKVQIIFQGDSQYAGSGSNIDDLTITSATLPNCEYKSNISLFSSSCNATCADPADFHCAVAKLNISRTFDELEGSSITQLLSPNSVKKDNPIFYNTHSDSKKLNGYLIGKIGVNLDSGFWSTTASGYQYACVFDNKCKAIGESMGCESYSPSNVFLLPSLKDGEFKVKQDSKGIKSPILTVKLMNPNTGECDIEIQDTNVLIEVVD